MKGWSFQALIEALKGAAFLDVGKVANTVAAGDDSRIVNALQSGNNLSDLVDADAARVNLFLGKAQNVTFNGVTTTRDVNARDLVASRNARVTGEVRGATGNFTTSLSTLNADFLSSVTVGPALTQDQIDAGAVKSGLSQTIWTIAGASTSNRQLWYRDDVGQELAVMYVSPVSSTNTNFQLRVKNASTFLFSQLGAFTAPSHIIGGGNITGKGVMIPDNSGAGYTTVREGRVDIGSNSTTATSALRLLDNTGAVISSLYQLDKTTDCTLRVTNGATGWRDYIFGMDGNLSSPTAMTTVSVYAGTGTQKSRMNRDGVMVGGDTAGTRYYQFNDTAGVSRMRLSQADTGGNVGLAINNANTATVTYTFGINGDFSTPGLKVTNAAAVGSLSVSGDSAFTTATFTGLTTFNNKVEANSNFESLTGGFIAKLDVNAGRYVNVGSGIYKTRIASSSITIGDDSATDRALLFQNSSGQEQFRLYQGSGGGIASLRVRAGTGAYQTFSWDIAGVFRAPGDIRSAGNLWARQGVYVGTDAAITGGTSGVLAPDGNIKGSIWDGGWLKDWLTTQIARRDSNIGNGWWKDEMTGLIIQWGSGSNPGSSQVTYNFPIPFPNAHGSSTVCLGVAVSNGNTVYMEAANRSQFNVKTSGGNMGFYWIALGT